MNKQKEIYQIIDANLNRAREGVRVVEEVVRFIQQDAKKSDQLKDLRHKIIKAAHELPISLDKVKLARNVEKDVGRNSFSESEKNKKDIQELVFANLQRVQESLRVLEEFSKLLDEKASFRFKKLRFRTYELEIKLLKKS